jgi:hypothetical protein
LWNDLKYIGAGPCERFIVAYLAAYMPRINRFLLDNRYDNGHLLSRTFTILDATTVCVIVGTELVWINWPISFSNFPPSAAIAHQVNALYVRDFIDAMASYFRGEFDDCIRRVITSVENFFQSKNWTTQVIRNGFWRALLGLKHRTRSVKFRRILLNNLELNTLFGEVVNSNMRLIYGTRNRIVHHGLRLGTSSGLFCDKAISTAYYLMYHYCGDPLIRRYLYTLNMQFTMLKSVLGTLYNLDAIERSKGFVTQGPVIETPQDMDRFMFESLRFDNRDKQSIYR